MNHVFEFFERLLTNFTWSRLTLTFVVLFLVIGSILGYEAYTQHFALQRLKEQVEIFDHLVTLSERLNKTENAILIGDSYHKLVTAFDSQLGYKTYLGPQSGSMGHYALPAWFTKSLYILLPWFVLSIYLLLSMTSGRASAMGGLMFFSSIFLVFGTLLPSFNEAPWFMKWAYPWGSMIGTVLLILIFDKRKQNKSLS